MGPLKQDKQAARSSDNQTSPQTRPGVPIGTVSSREVHFRTLVGIPYNIPTDTLNITKKEKAARDNPSIATNHT